MSPPVDVAVLMLQPQCNMICDFCITEDAMGSLSWEEATHLLKKFQDQGVKKLVIGGGEPFLWKPGLLDFCEAAQKKGFHVQVGTNGIQLKEVNDPRVDRWVLPLESTIESVHNQMRQHSKNHFQVMQNLLVQLIVFQKSVTLSTVITQVNMFDIVNLGEFLRTQFQAGLPLHAWHIYQFIPMGRGGQLNASRLQVSDEKYEEVFQKVRDLRLPFKVYKRKNMYNSLNVKFYSKDEG